MALLVTFVTTTTRLRTVGVWSAVTLGAVGVAVLTVPVITRGPRPAFVDALTWACAVAALVAGSAAWWVTTDVARGVLAGTAPHERTPGPVRAAILLACGLSLLGGPALAHGPVASPGDAGPTDARGGRQHPVAGLPLPDRPAGDASPDRTPASAPSPDTLTVRPGDHLWGIARERLGPSATNARVAAHVRALHEHNADVIGADPDLILPGQRLRLPPTPGRDAR